MSESMPDGWRRLRDLDGVPLSPGQGVYRHRSGVEVLRWGDGLFEDRCWWLPGRRGDAPQWIELPMGATSSRDVAMRRAIRAVERHVRRLARRAGLEVARR